MPEVYRLPEPRTKSAGSAGPLYQRVLGPSWSELDQAVRQSHLDGEAMQAGGLFQIQHGGSRWAKWLCRTFALPPALTLVNTRLTITRDGAGEKWLREFGDSSFVSIQSERAGSLLVERIGRLELWFRLNVDGGRLVYRQVAASLRCGPVRIPLPRWCGPRVAAHEEPDDGPNRTRVFVEVSLPLVGLLIAYTGTLVTEESRP
jgi:uncharacterized protein DUF4166